MGQIRPNRRTKIALVRLLHGARVDVKARNEKDLTTWRRQAAKASKNWKI
jgi:hypothetical protein